PARYARHPLPIRTRACPSSASIVRGSGKPDPRWERVKKGATIAFVGAMLLTGCAVGPDFVPPAAPDVPGYTPEPLAPTTSSANTKGGETQHFVRDLDLPGQWWTLFHSKPLNSVVERALIANQDLAAAQAALRVARENVRVGQGALFPSID